MTVMGAERAGATKCGLLHASRQPGPFRAG